MSKHHSGAFYYNAAPKSEYFDHSRPGKGDHVVVYAKDGSSLAICMHKELANGTECAIKKWFRNHLGLVLAGFIGLAILSLAMFAL